MKNRLLLRNVRSEDLPVFFQNQMEPEANRMAGFPPRDREAFDKHWSTKIIGDASVIKKTIVFDGAVAGHIVSWEQDGQQEIGYWIGQDFWGQGIASLAMADFLASVEMRPLHAHVVKHNSASLRVLEKSGFKVSSENGEEIILVLEASDNRQL